MLPLTIFSTKKKKKKNVYVGLQYTVQYMTGSNNWFRAISLVKQESTPLFRLLPNTIYRVITWWGFFKAKQKILIVSSFKNHIHSNCKTIPRKLMKNFKTFWETPYRVRFFYIVKRKRTNLKLIYINQFWFSFYYENVCSLLFDVKQNYL